MNEARVDREKRLVKNITRGDYRLTEVADMLAKAKSFVQRILEHSNLNYDITEWKHRTIYIGMLEWCIDELDNAIPLNCLQIFTYHIFDW